MLYSILIPLYNSEKSIESLVEAMMYFFKKRPYTFEVVLVDDASTDGTKKVVEALCDTYKEVNLIKHIENKGQQRALFNGVRHCKGDYIITIDDDLQHGVDAVEAMIQMSEMGYDLAFGIYEAYGKNGLRQIGSKSVGTFFKWRYKSLKNNRVSSVRLIAKHVYEPVCNLHRPFVYLSAELIPFAKCIGNCKIYRYPRKYGKSGYSFKKLLKITLKLIFYYGILYRLKDAFRLRVNKLFTRIN